MYWSVFGLVLKTLQDLQAFWGICWPFEVVQKIPLAFWDEHFAVTVSPILTFEWCHAELTWNLITKINRNITKPDPGIPAFILNFSLSRKKNSIVPVVPFWKQCNCNDVKSYLLNFWKSLIANYLMSKCGVICLVKWGSRCFIDLGLMLFIVADIKVKNNTNNFFIPMPFQNIGKINYRSDWPSLLSKY